jgi:hypothetical protein
MGEVFQGSIEGRAGNRWTGAVGQQLCGKRQVKVDSL